MTKVPPLEIKPGTWYHRPKVLDDPKRTVWLCYYPHVKDGETQTGIVVVLDTEPEATQLERAKEKFTEYVEKEGIKLIENPPR